MATYDLKYPGAAIDAILDTAYHLQQAGYIFRGSASDYSGTPTEREWVIAPAGFSGLGLSSAVPQGSIGVCLYTGTAWVGKIINVATIDSTPTQNSGNAVSSGGAYAAINQLSASVTEALENLTFTDTTPSAFQDEYINMKVSTTEGGVERILTYLTILAATTSKAGLLSAADKVKIDSFLANLRLLTFADTTASADQGTQITETLKATIGGVQEVIDSITILAATSSKAGLLSASDKAYIDALPATLTSLSNSISGALALMQSLVGYYVCDTAAGTAAKTVDATGYSLTNGGCIRIKMTNANTAANVTLNINSTGAKALYYDGAQASSTNTWEAGEVLEVYYDGTQYQCASGGGGKFATGEKVKDTSITNTLTSGSDALATSGAVYDDMVGIEASHYNSGGHINSTGTVSNAQYFCYSDYIPCQNGDAVEWNPSYTSSGVYLALYDSSKNFIRAYNCTPSSNLSFVISNSNAAYLRSSAALLRLSECYVKINGEYAWYPAGKAGIIDQKLAPVIERFNLNGMFWIDGDNDNYAKSPLITGVIAGHTYRLGIKFPNIDMSGVTVTGSNYIRLAVKVFDGETDTGNVVDVRIGTPLKDSYTFTIPSTVSNPSVQVWMRFTSGYKEYICVEDSGAGGSSSEWESLNYSVIARRGAIWNTGTISTSLSSTSATDYIDVSLYKQIRCMMTRVNAVIDGAAGGIVFYDANKAYLKGYYYRTVDGTNVSMSSTEVRVFDIPTGAKYVIINMLNDHVSQFFAEGRRNIEAEVKNGDDYYDRYANIGHPSIYRSQPTADANESLNGKTVDELYAEYDDLATRFPDYFRRTADIATVTKSNVSYVLRSYELRYNKYFQQTSEPTDSEILNYDNNLWNGKYNPRKIVVISGMHGEEKTPTWGLMLSIKEILESNEDWALFIRANCVLAIAPCVNPSGWQSVVRTDSAGNDMNRNTSYADPECVGLLKWHYDNRDAEVAFDVHGSQGRYMYFPNSNWYPMANIHNRFYGRLVVAMQNEWKSFYDSISQGYGTTYAPFMLLQQGNGEGYPTSFASWSTRLAYKIGMQQLPIETPDSLSTGNRSNNDLRMCKLTKDMFINLLMIHIGVKDMPKNDINRQVVDMPEPGWNT